MSDLLRKFKKLKADVAEGERAVSMAKGQLKEVTAQLKAEGCKSLKHTDEVLEQLREEEKELSRTLLEKVEKFTEEFEEAFNADDE